MDTRRSLRYDPVTICPAIDEAIGWIAAGANGSMAVKKQDVIELMRIMPEEFDPEELMYHLYVLAKIRRSEASIAKHGLIPDEELDEHLKEWRD